MANPQPGERYKHFKGGEYEIVCLARNCDNVDEVSVIYKMLYNSGNFPRGTIWQRSLEDFCGDKELENGGIIKRFVKIE